MIMKGEKMAKRTSFGSAVKTSFGSAVKKRLSDITNLQSDPKVHGQDQILVPISPSSKDCISKLIKENAALMRLIEERNQLIELSGVEIQKLKIFSQKLQLQNWNLAQSNSHILAEVNVGKDKIKVLQHEIACKEAVLKAKKLAMVEGKDIMKCQKDGEKKDAEKKCLPKWDDENKSDNVNIRRASRSQSMGPWPTLEQAAEKEAAKNKRHCSRGQSARFNSEKSEPKEDLFEIEDSKFPTSKPLDVSMHNEKQTRLGSSKNNDQRQASEFHNSRRSSIGRPSRRASEKVQSYKEVPLNIKMRRDE